ncbi:FAD-binding oxidoreductase [Sphingorhabdus lacus]|uniref:FAD-binding oxidoreductase n=1 Tax=Sphingorhabdus lacus TaxID=392610 RepID=A0A6I6L190_9SPHN|nr:FAD-binding oxidoreductase [Sphingorhabdus lacus]QGY79250.1 FAD-binding oxidoreductase [Sphingorhabdus lacus]
MPLPLPPNVSAANFRTALVKFKEAIGKRWVFDSEEDVMLYRDGYSPLRDEPEELLPSAAVAPQSVAEVQAIVRIANEFMIPLFPISTGKNLGYGGSSPNLSGSVVVDLKRMNKIIEVDDHRHFCIVEPGVAYFDLYRHIQENKLKVWIDCPDPGWGSVVGNSLDHGVGYTYGHHRDHFSNHCGMEVVLPNGEIMRTGMGALPGAKTWGEYKHGFGPSVDGLFAQGNFGIVTKMGFWLMPEPEAYISGTVSVPKRQDLIPLVDVVNYLEHTGMIGMPNYGSPLEVLMNEPKTRDFVLRPEITDAEFDSLAADLKLASWTCELQFYGAKESVKANWEAAQRRLAAAIPDATFKLNNEFRFPMTPDEQEAVHQKNALGIPSMLIFSQGARSDLNPTPRDGHLWFASVIPKSGEAIFEAQKVYAKASRELGLPPVFSPFAFPWTWMYRAFVMISGLPVSRTDIEGNKRNRKLFSAFIKAGAEAGYGEYRAPPAFQDQVSNTYSFNNHVLRRFTETMKDAVDPNGIFAPGRGGIWPKNLREKRK